MHTRQSSRRAFTLIDLLVTIVVMTIIAALVMPTVSRGTQINLTSAAITLASDLEYTQSLSLASPQNPALVKFNSLTNTYWIAYVSDPDAPIVRPGTTNEPYRVTYGQGLASSFEGVTIDTSALTGDIVVFDSYGRLVSLAPAPIRLTSSDGRENTILVDASTGFVTIQ
jgi:type II secretory pathway pseudopilin PulG